MRKSILNYRAALLCTIALVASPALAQAAEEPSAMEEPSATEAETAAAAGPETAGEASVTEAPAAGAAGEAPVTEAPEKPAADIVVTGSRVSRANIDNAVPTLVLGEDRLEQMGMENFADIATQLPQFAASFGTTRTQSTFSGAAASGLNTVNLRNLSAQRALMLINGRRVPAGTTINTVVDFNTIPISNVDRVEVITGGASAIYGADAVAGVINIITKKRFNGFEVGAKYGISERGDNKNPNAYALFGTSLGDRGHALLTLEYDFLSKVGCEDRYICEEDFAWLPPAAPVRGPGAYSAVGLNGRFFIGSGSFTRDASGNFVPFSTPLHGYNRNPDRTLAQPTRRLLAAVQADYEIGENVEAFAEFNYGSSNTEADFEGHPFQSNSAGNFFGGGPGVPGLQATIPIDNPFIPSTLRAAAIAAGQTSITWHQRFSVIADRGAKNERQTIRLVGGLRGEFDLGQSSPWNWEVSYVHGRTSLNGLTNGLVSTRNLYYGLRVEPDPARPGQYRCIDAGARATGCVPINPFAPYTDDMKKALTVTAGQSGRSVLNDIQAYVSGSLVELPAGPLGIAAGFEYRTFSGFLDFDEVINKSEVTGNQLGDVGFSKRKTKEAFIEAAVPILKDTRFAKSLSVEGAVRYSNPSSGGNYSTWRYGGTWEPVDGLRIRAMRARSVREPAPGEVSGVAQTFGTVLDPCTAARRNTTPTRAANCAAAGVPATYNPSLSIQQSVGGFVGANPDLEPEQATTLTYGFAATPRFLPGFVLTVDRFEIDLRDIITTVGRQTKADLCYDSGLFCADITRGTDPSVPGATYVLKAVNDQLINVASLDVKGFDIEARYTFPIASGHKIMLQGMATIYDKASQIPLPGQDPIDMLGFAGGSTSDQGFIKFTGAANIGYSSNLFKANWNIRYIGKAKTSPFASDAYPTIGDRYYHNVRVAFTPSKTYEFYAGVNNVLDSDPPFFPTSVSGTQALDTIPAYYDVFGRSYYAGVKAHF